MSFLEKMHRLAEHVANARKHVRNEDDTKQYLVLPFLEALGYNPFDPTETWREHNPESLHARQTRADYMIKKEGKPIVAVECKTLGHTLGQDEIAQLAGYYTFDDATIGILTDGIKYRFFANKAKANVMDEHPFYDFDIGTFEDAEVEILEWLTKSSFDPELMVVATKEYSVSVKPEGNQSLEVPQKELQVELAERPQVQIEGGHGSMNDAKEFRPRDYKARDIFYEILEGLASDKNELELGYPPKAKYTFLKLLKPSDGKLKRLARVEHTNELRIKIYIWNRQRKRTQVTLETWEQLRGYSREIEQYARDFLGR